MSSSKRKNRKKKKEKSDFFSKKIVGGQDSYDFDAQELARTNSSKELTLGDKIENGMHNAGEIVEEQANIFKKNTKNIRNVNKMGAEDAVKIVDKLIPQKFVRWTIRLVIGVYGFLGIISIILLIFYCLDYFISTIYSTYSSYDYIFLYIMIGLCSIGAIIGLYGTFKYGEIDEQMKILNDENEKLRNQIHSVSQDGEKLKESISAFQTQVDCIMDNEQDLKSQIKAFQRLENDLKLESKSNNQEIIEFLKQVQKLFREFKILQTQVEKANLLNLFYELEFRDDNEEGLNRKEFDMFLARLDEQTANKFKKFHELDRNGDNNIDINEFQSELDRIFNRLNTANSMFGLKTKRNKNNYNNDNNKSYTKPNLTDWKNWL